MAMPKLRPIGVEDIRQSLLEGIRDFRSAPAFGLFFGAVFSTIGIVVLLQLMVWESTYWILPIAAGYPLVGPFLAAGLYEVSRVLERGERPDWASVLAAPFRAGSGQVQWMAFIVLFFFMVWVYLAQLIFALSFGLNPMAGIASSSDFLFSGRGLVMLLLGTATGGVIAVVLFAVTVISVPMLMDRDVDVVTAMVTSSRSVIENQKPMLIWGLVIAVTTAVAMVPLFLGMILALPILGHASWHLYRKAVERA